METEAQRFWPRVEFTKTCWLWSGPTDKDGYGRFSISMRPHYAHRWAYEFCVGPIPKGLEIDHLCRITNCVLPDHLEAVTHRENMLRGVSIVAQCARVTECPQGHPYNAENTRIKLTDGSRNCRVCQREGDAMRRIAKVTTEAQP